MLCGGLFRYYLPGGYIFKCVIAITKTGCDTGYFGKSRVAACFSITCQAVSYYLDRVWHGVFWEIPCGGLFQYYLPDGQFQHQISSGLYDSGYVGKRLIILSIPLCFQTYSSAVD